MNKADVFRAMSLPDAIVPSVRAMTAKQWKCGACGQVHTTDWPVRASTHSPCRCGSICFEKMPEVLQ